MARRSFYVGVVTGVLGLAAAGAFAESRNPSDYPLRLHIYTRSQTTFYRHEWVDAAKGDGRANLFENGEARGIDFSYDCGEKLKDSFGYETYPAKWKKPGKELVVLLPEFGEAGKYFTCNLKTDVKDFAYTRHRGNMDQEPVADYKKWMTRVDYDPEHGKNLPRKSDESSVAQPAATAAPAPAEAPAVAPPTPGAAPQAH